MENGLNGNLTKNLTKIYQAQVAYYGETTDKFDVQEKKIDNLKNFIFSPKYNSYCWWENIHRFISFLSHIENPNLILSLNPNRKFIKI